MIGVRFTLFLLCFFIQINVHAQSSIDDFVGKWYVLGITQIDINQQVIMLKGECTTKTGDYLSWDLNSDMRFYRAYREYTYRDSLPPIVQEIQWGSEKWKCFPETQTLYTGSDKYEVIKITRDSLLVKRLE